MSDNLVPVVDLGDGTSRPDTVGIIFPPSAPSSPQVRFTESTAPHTVYEIHTQYLWTSGNLQLPNAGPSPYPNVPTSVIASMSAPFQLAVVTWSASRVGDKPILPSPVTPHPGWTLMSVEITVENPNIGADGLIAETTCSGTYVYAIDIPIAPGTVDMIGPTDPSINLTLTNTVIPATQFTEGLF